MAAAAAAPWAAWAAVRVLGLDLAHPVVAAMAFTPYVALTSPLPVALALLLGRRAVAVVATVAAVALAAAVLPRATGAAGERDGRPLVVMTSNLEHGQGDPQDVLRLVREHEVDVLSLQELTPQAVARLDAAGIRRLLPGRVLDARPEGAGTGLMARWPLRRTGAPDLGGVAHPEAALRLPGGGPLRVKAVHPPPPIDAGSTRTWQTALRRLPGPRAGAAPRIVAGDFNATLDHRAFRRLLARGFADAAAATGAGLRPTWPAEDRDRPPITIDHIVVPAGIAVRRTSVHPVAGSDHHAVIAELVLPRG